MMPDNDPGDELMAAAGYPKTEQPHTHTAELTWSDDTNSDLSKGFGNCAICGESIEVTYRKFRKS